MESPQELLLKICLRVGFAHHVERALKNLKKYKEDSMSSSTTDKLKGR